MPDVRYGRIVRKVERVVPFLITVEHSGSETFGPETLPVGIDLYRPLVKCFAVAVEMPVMVEIVYGHLESPLPNGVNVRRTDFISFFRHNLKCRLEPERFIQVHHHRGSVTPQIRLHVMGHDSSRGST